MQNVKLTVILPAFVAIFFAGCATKQAPIQQVERIESTPVVFVLPLPEKTGTADTTMMPQDWTKRMRFQTFNNVGPGDVPEVNALQIKTEGDRFQVERFKAVLVSSRDRYINKVSVSYTGTVRVTAKTNSIEVIYSLEGKNSIAEPSIITGKPRFEVSYTPADVARLLGNGELIWKFEVDSQFPSDATYANFARLTRVEAFRGVGERDSVTGKIFKERFWVRVGGRDVPINVETYPYRSGSKVIVYATISGAKSGNTVDFSTTLDALKKEVEKIVRS